MSSTPTSITSGDLDLVLEVSGNIVVVIGSRLRCSGEDADILDTLMLALPPTLFRVTGAISGAEDIVERMASAYGHEVEVWGPDKDPEGMVKRLHKADTDVFFDMVDGSTSVWMWVQGWQLPPSPYVRNHPVVAEALKQQTPVLLFHPQSESFRVEVL